MKWFDRLFKLEEINGGNRCPTYLYRWTLLKAKDWSVYLLHFVGDDPSLDLHDHPKRFISIGLWGKYNEWQSETDILFDSPEVFRAPWIRTFPAEHRHRLSMIDGGTCWTLVIVLKAVRPWGFWRMGKFIPFREYVNGKIADARKACP
jgi:hypothetical protein